MPKMTLDALFGDLIATSEKLATTTLIPLSQIEPDPEQPRRTWLEEPLRELAASIREQGLLQPVLVRPVGRDRYMLIAGERRWRAAGMAELSHVPAVVKDVDTATVRIMALVENLQREDLRDEERAAALQELKRLRRATWEEVGRWVGLSEPRVKALAQLTKEPAEIQALLGDSVSEKHLSLTRPLKDARRLTLLREVARRGLTTIQTRQIVDLLREDESLSVMAALQQVVPSAVPPKRSPAERVYGYVRWLERFDDVSVEAAEPDLVEALATLEKQVRALRRRLGG